MMLRILIVFAVLVFLGLFLALGVGAARWRRANEAVLASLREPGAGTSIARHHEAALEGLPEPVVRYFRRVLREGQPIVRHARLEQAGTFLTRAAPETWSKFTATEEFAPERRGFVWLARIHMAPGIDVHVRDSYRDGTGRMRGELLRLIPVVDMGETPEMAAGALTRYLAEAVWFPTALLPGHGVQWTGIDDSTARATLSDHGTTVWMEFRFAPTGEIVSSYATSRARGMNGRYETLPWGGEYRAYKERSGMRIPLEAEVAWWIEGRRAPYWRGRTTRADFDVAAP